MIPIEQVDLKPQYKLLREEINSAIQQVLEEMQLFLGKNVFLLEEEFAQYCGARFAIGVGSGTEALHLALIASGIGPQDEVITVAHSFIATAEAITFTGARPVFVDIDPIAYTMDPSQIEAAINPRTKAILPVHIYGQPADMDPILAISRKYGLLVIEDACQANGALYNGSKVGSIGDAAAFSFYHSNNLGAYGEGGMVVTKHRNIATKVQVLRNHGAVGKDRHALLGFNSRLDEIQAAILRVKLPHLDDWNTLRRAWAREYDKLLMELEEIERPQEAVYAKHVYHFYVIRVPNRAGLRRCLKAHGISTAVEYPLHLQEACQVFGYAPGSLPVTEACSQETLYLPMYPELTLEQIRYICQIIKDFYRERRRRRLDRSRGERPRSRPWQREVDENDPRPIHADNSPLVLASAPVRNSRSPRSLFPDPNRIGG